MTKRSLLISFFLISVRGIVRNFRAFFRGFTEEDACALLSAYGLYGLEVARLQNDRSNEEKETNRSFSDAHHRNSIDGFPDLISVGVHPDIFRTKRTNGSRNHARRLFAGFSPKEESAPAHQRFRNFRFGKIRKNRELHS